MAIGLYKPGQGYWVRVLTATLIAVFTLAAGAWMFRQMGLVADKLPRSVWSIELGRTPSPAPTPGQAVTLVGKPVSGGDIAPEIGAAVVDSYEGASSLLRVRDVSMKDGAREPIASAAVKLAAAPALPVKTIVGIPAIEPFLLQGLAAGVVLILGAILAYYFTAMHQRFVDFLIATDGEMKKVHWSTVKDIRKSTLVVIFAALMLSATLFVVDFGFQWFFKTIGILVSS